MAPKLARLLKVQDRLLLWIIWQATIIIVRGIRGVEMKIHLFDRNKHVHHSEAFVELVKDAVRFFNGTPVHPLPLQERFLGTGVYALYYTGNNKIYRRYAELNRLEYKYPVYVGKAVPRGWRQSRISDDITKPSAELYSRIREHTRNSVSIRGILIRLPGLTRKTFRVAL